MNFIVLILVLIARDLLACMVVASVTCIYTQRVGTARWPTVEIQ